MSTAPDPQSQPAGRFASAWDQYVATAPPGGRWPGDEWGDEALWRTWFDRLFVGFGVAAWQRAMEVGQGSGKYTELVLAAGGATVAALDVSPKFQAVCAARLAAPIANGRLSLHLVDERDPHALSATATRLGWCGRTDAVYSIDTLVHLTTTQIASLLLEATSVLRPDGVFVGTFADASSVPGQDKLFADIERVMRSGGDPATGCFHWTSPAILAALARRCGYTVELCATDTFHGRDGLFVFRFTDAATASALRAACRR